MRGSKTGLLTNAVTKLIISKKLVDYLDKRKDVFLIRTLSIIECLGFHFEGHWTVKIPPWALFYSDLFIYRR